MSEFQAFPKIPRLRRDMVVTEKIDGTNACVVIADDLLANWAPGQPLGDGVVAYFHDTPVHVYAQSRNRVITPEKDNFGFAAWVRENAALLAQHLGPGRHFGEWWGSGIQRGYGLPKGEKRFSLFNTHRWDAGEDHKFAHFDIPGLYVVPVITRYTFSTVAVDGALDLLRTHGSFAAPGFMNPEGIIVYHTAAGQMFKMTFEHDEAGKGQ